MILYFYGKRTAQWFKENHLWVILFLFLGSVLGSGVYFLVTDLLLGFGVPFIWEVAFETMDTGVFVVFVGFTAFALSQLRVGNLPTAPEQNLPV